MILKTLHFLGLFQLQIGNFLDYYQQKGNAPKRVDSYDFVHDTNTFTLTDIPQDNDFEEYYSYIDKNSYVRVKRG